MSAAIRVPVVNQLLASLPHKESTRILECCEPVDLVFGTILCESEQSLRHLYFPLTGFISLITRLRDHQPLEMGLVGNEGMLGATLILGMHSVPMRAVVQAAIDDYAQLLS